ncbi:CES2 [Branchiostoma lanceolatum]|uniref:Carboxylic ester hydrolase n=1 Tax=Branchiostoma lanceolatum TaxID=7740 RepID=A0A8J9YQT7_BRALA|nr:CES2 [Branchiostoma lanceolatum]
MFIIQFFSSTGRAQDGVASEPTPVVSTPSGQVRGTVRSAPAISNKPVFTFLGIPFAAPPVGDLRFRPPEPVVPWEGVMDADEFGPNCPQNLAIVRATFPTFIPLALPHDTVSEDCLVLNILTTSLGISAPLPVMVWIPGGFFTSGTGSMYNFTALAAYQDVVVVTINYRLGALGFLSTGDDNAPGNYGLLDQIQALRWIKLNIRGFGGDPDRVTIFGVSGGGVSVSYLLLSPLSSGLFHRAIAQSGTALTIPTTPNPLAAATAQAEEVGCEHQNVKAMMSCLRQKPLQDIVDSASRVERRLGGQGSALFSPVVDKHFISDSTKNVIKSGKFNTVPCILGLASHEFGYLLPHLLFPGFGDGMPHGVCTAIIKNMLSQGIQALNMDEVMADVLKEYQDPEEQDGPMAEQKRLCRICEDYTFLVPLMGVANAHVDAGGPVYLYEAQHRPATTAYKPDWIGCDHGDDINFITGLPFLGEDGPSHLGEPLMFSEDDRNISLDMMEYWANFARTGDPTDSTGSSTLKSHLTTWPPYTPENPAYLKLAMTSSSDVGLKADRLRFWNALLQPTPSNSANYRHSKEEL